MLKALLVASVLFNLALPCWAGYVDDIKLQIEDIESQLKYKRAQLDHATGQDAEQLIHDIYYLRQDRLTYIADYYKATIENSQERDTALRKNDQERVELDRAYQTALDNAYRSVKPTVDNLSIAETKRSYGYIYYSLKVDVDNPGPAGKIFVTVKGRRYDGHELESVNLNSDLSTNDRTSLTDSTMVKESDALNISKWEIAEVKFYPN